MALSGKERQERNEAGQKAASKGYSKFTTKDIGITRYNRERNEAFDKGYDSTRANKKKK